jgi:hypothetical protein
MRIMLSSGKGKLGRPGGDIASLNAVTGKSKDVVEQPEFNRNKAPGESVLVMRSNSASQFSKRIHSCYTCSTVQ